MAPETAGSAGQDRITDSAAPRWPVGSSWWFTEEFLSDAAGVDKREGEFDFAGATWQRRETISDELGRRT